jgi:hypothetical protein
MALPFFKNRTSIHLALVCSTQEYRPIMLTYDKTLGLFSLKAHTVFAATHGEFGNHIFINHTAFFRNVTQWLKAQNITPITTAFLGDSSLVNGNIPLGIPVLVQDEQHFSLPFFMQCTLFAPQYKIPFDVITSVEHAHEHGVHVSGHPYNSATLQRLLIKKTIPENITPADQQALIAACGSYSMEFL